MRRLLIKANTAITNSDPAKYHTHIDLGDNTTPPRFKLAGFSYFGEVGGLRHIPTTGHVILYPDRNDSDWDRVLKQGTNDPYIRMTYAEWLKFLADHHVNMVRTWVFDLNEADSYPFSHHLGSIQYDLATASNRYLRRLSRFVDIARQYGIVVHVTLTSDQMFRPRYWAFLPFAPAHSIVDAFPTPASFFDINNTADPASMQRRQLQRAFITSLTTALKPYWNVMFEVMNEACVGSTTEAQVAPWATTIRQWLVADLTVDGVRTHLITLSAKTEAQSVVRAVRPDILSLHGTQWGNGSDPVTDTRNLVRNFQNTYPNLQFAFICDADSFDAAKADPKKYATVAMRDLSLNYGHRWDSNYLTHALLDQQITGLSQAVNGIASSQPDTSGRPAPIPVVTPEESIVAGSWVVRGGVTGAKDIGSFRQESVWVIADPAVGTAGDASIYQWHIDNVDNGNGHWVKIDGSAMRIAVGPDGLPWVVNAAHQIFRRNPTGTWTQITGPAGDGASDISVGGDGTVWIIGSNPVVAGSADHAIYRRDLASWTKLDNAGVRIAVNPVGEAWMTNAAKGIFAHDGARGWIQVPGAANDVAVGLDDTMWVIGTNQVPEGFGIYYWAGTDFRGIDGGGVAIAVDHDGMPWVTKSNLQVSQRFVSANG